MNSLWKIVRTAMAILGLILIFGAVGTSDYYVLELGMREPDSVWKTIFVGVILTVPMWIHLTHRVMKGDY